MARLIGGLSRDRLPRSRINDLSPQQAGAPGRAAPGAAGAAPRRAPDGRSEPIAVVGMGCRFPGGADDPEAFWELLAAAASTRSREVPADRWDVDALYDAGPGTPPGKMATRWGGFLDGVDQLRRRSSSASRRARRASMDPQQRLLLEVAWEALERRRASRRPPRRAAATGVFVGICVDATTLQLPDARAASTASTRYLGHRHRRRASPPAASPTCSACTGRALAVDTACSSSLVAVHLAVQSLRAGECDLALAGGVNLILLARRRPSPCRKARMLSPDGRCKTFDARRRRLRARRGLRRRRAEAAGRRRARRRPRPRRDPRHRPSTRTAAATASPRRTGRPRRP